jgi:hypothetical protein
MGGYVRLPTSSRGRVAGDALGASVLAAVLVVVAEVPSGWVDGAWATPAREALSRVHAVLVVGAQLAVLGPVATGRCCASLPLALPRVDRAATTALALADEGTTTRLEADAHALVTFTPLAG